MLSKDTLAEYSISLQELFPNYTNQFLEPFQDVISPNIHEGMHLNFEIDDRDHKNKINPILRLARPEDARDLIEIYKELYNGTYPYKEMEDEAELRKMIEDPSVQWIIYQDPSFNIAGCITFVLDFENKRGYIRGFMLKKKYQRHLDITKAMIGSMIGMLHRYHNKIYTWYVENRTAHAKSQYSMWVCGIAPIGFYPNKDIFLGKVESDLMQVLYDERVLRRYRSKAVPRIIPDVEACYVYSNDRYDLGEYEKVRPELRPNSLTVLKLGRKLKRSVSKDEFGYETIRLSFKGSDSYFQFLYTPRVQNFEKTEYKVNSLEELYVFAEKFMKCKQELGVRYCEIFVSAYNPEHQKIFRDLGYLPRGYIPSWSFNSEVNAFEDHVLFNCFDGEISEKMHLIDEGKRLFQVLDTTCYSYEKRKNPKSKVKKLLMENKDIIQKVAKPCLLLVLCGYILLVFLSVSLAHSFNHNLLLHTISDLGSILYSPIPTIFNSSCIVAGVLAIPFYLKLHHKLVHLTFSTKLTSYILHVGSICGVCGGLGFLCVGIFTIDNGGILHNIVTILAFTGYVLSISAISVFIILCQSKIPRVVGIIGLLCPLVILGCFLIFFIPLLEWILYFTIIAYLIPFNIWTFLS